MQVKKQQLEPDLEQQTDIGKGVHQGCMLSLCLFNFYAEYIMRNARLDEAQAGIKIAERNTNNLRYADDTTLMAEREEELKRLLVKESEKAVLKLSIQKRSWHPVHHFMANRRGNNGNSKRLYFFRLQNHRKMVTAAMKLKDTLLGRKAMNNLDSIFKSREITLLTKVYLVKSYGFSSSHVWV